MEEIRAYIESGVLELYVLGDLSAEEKLQVEVMAQKYPEVRAELEEIENALEDYADVHHVEPAGELKNRVLNSLLTNFGDDRNFPSISHDQQPARVVEMKPQRPTTSVFYKYAFAASLLLLCLSVASLGVVYKRLQTKEQQLISLRLSEQKFSRQVSVMDEEIAVFRDPSFRFVQLKGTAKTPSSGLTVAWSPKRRKVMVDLVSANLPAPDKDHQYQLWAIANGKPVDLGVFDNAHADSADMKEMKSIALAQAFAVTIEPRGGSVNPTLNQMVVMASL
ncbi:MULTISPECIES: anti-sigma factor [unclassified Mucilaginibacter]|uniref:anti-sigma factor n=1 Tax=unclassified Mucilaginibacter TaxID=2617802 RepID=UPI0031F713D6